MTWSAPLARELLLRDGRVLRTLRDARELFASGAFSGITHSPPLEHAIELLIRAAETGDEDDIAVATNQIAVALRVHGMMT
jgi:hypothetical protein